jgi:hypothetical protein
LNLTSGIGASLAAAALREASSCMTMKWKTMKWNTVVAASAAYQKKMSRSAALYEPQHKLEENNLQQQWKGGPYRNILWVSDFTLAGRNVFLKSMDIHSGHIP